MALVVLAAAPVTAENDAAAPVTAENDQRKSTNHTFRIHLVKDKVNLMKLDEVNLQELKLHQPPLITESDVVEYDWQTHTIRLTEKGVEPFVKPGVRDLPVKYDDETRTLKAEGENHEEKVALLGKAFVVIADGQRCYLGVFTSSFSSLVLSLPVINLCPIPEEAPSKNSIRIDRAYPSDDFGKGKDPRSDPRVRLSLDALGKLSKER
jgi:hypothetical protein